MREDQIQRYGRQILLRELGGRGQAKLSAHSVEVAAGGPGIAEAVTYLAAGGTPIRLAPGVTLDGFTAALEPLNADALAPAPVGLLLSPVTAGSDAPVQVVVGAGVAWRDGSACPACWARTRAQLQPGGSAPVTVGSLAALAAQRLLLGWSTGLGLVTWDGARLIEPEPSRCDAHRAL